MQKVFFVLSLTTSLFFISCTKTTTIATPAPTNANPIEGFWVGSYQLDGAANLGEFYYASNIFSDSTILQEGGGGSGSTFLSKGTWSLHGTQFTATLTATDLTEPVTVQTISAIYDSVAGTLSNGRYQFTVGGGSSPSGSFALKRVK